MENRLFSTEILTSSLKSKGIKDWDSTIKYIQNLPYGRNKNRVDISLVLTEEKGTCSSKHAFLKQVAIENNLREVKLFIGIYKMTQKNTPEIGTLLSENNLPYLPEAHCYLKIEGTPLDVTSVTSSFDVIENDILKEIKILPHQVSDYKVDLHRNYLNKWLISEGIDKSFDEIWALRELCIEYLSIS